MVVKNSHFRNIYIDIYNSNPVPITSENMYVYEKPFDLSKSIKFEMF